MQHKKHTKALRPRVKRLKIKQALVRVLFLTRACRHTGLTQMASL